MTKQTQRITTLGEFLHQSGAQYRIIDMARRVTKIANDDFADIELANKPYPYPLQKKAHFGVVFWNPKDAEEHYIWFLSFPLDEQGLLLQAARDEFLVMLLDRVGECMLAANEGEQIEGALKDSPYTFKPRDDKMAAFHAQASHQLGLPASQYYPAALAYFTGKTDSEQWQNLAMQGVADVAMRIEDKSDMNQFIAAHTTLAESPFITLCQHFENRILPTALVETFAAYLNAQLTSSTPHIGLISACLRAVSYSKAQGLVDDMVKQTLNHSVAGRNIEVLATISGRLWRVLEQPTLCQLFLTQLAENEAGQQGFSHIIADAIFMPGLREPIMTVLRSPDRTPALSQCVGHMFGQTSAS